jgi:hypothetical protein
MSFPRVLARYRSRVQDDDGFETSSNSDDKSRKRWTYRPPEYRSTSKYVDGSADAVSAV